ncbi:GNAT family N-acetyltransferase [Herbiconiux solani]|uniref:GNAT family N-acetyltransferase n=1 Tax=Herbiconiux solani TaxID=661329 RepID=UPI0008269BDC|nr:GNAT family N-acetyltransferase [Herbiconiux solani]
MEWPVIEVLESERLTLEPVSVDHASAMVDVLSDARLYEFTGGEPPSLDVLAARYRRQVRGPADGSGAWFNWMLRERAAGTLVGFVQATVHTGDRGPLAEIAWLIDPAHQRQGFAAEATAAMVAWLRSRGVTAFAALIHPDHTVSQRVAHRLDLRPTPQLDDGEVRWESPPGNDETP